MKQMIIAVSLLLAFGVGCDEGQDRQLPDGTKLFGVSHAEQRHPT